MGIAWAAIPYVITRCVAAIETRRDLRDIVLHLERAYGPLPGSEVRGKADPITKVTKPPAKYIPGSIP